MSKSMQDHAAAATATDPNVQYAYEDGSGGADLDANFVRPDYVTYPGPSARRVVYYNYASTGVGAPMSRLDNIASAGSPTASQKYASYMYLGAGTMVDANYPAVTGIPALTYGSRVNSYSGFDRFGRVVDQKWQNQSGTPTVNDRFRYAYDRASNRTSRDPAADSHTPPDANDNYYTYDGLDRLVKSNWGTLDVNGVITDQNADANQAWSLDPVGNWEEFKWDVDGGGAGDPTVQARAHNTANEIQAISGTGTDWVDPTYDLAGNMISGPQPRHETVDANTQWYKYDAWNRLVEVSQGASSPGTKVAQYRYDGLNRRIRKYVASDYVIAYCGQDVLCGPGLLMRPRPTSYWNVTEYYYNESWQVLEAREALEVERLDDPLEEPPVSEAVWAREQYVWGMQYIDAPVVRFRDEVALYYMYDGNFNVTAVIGTDGTVAERYTYDPYGQVTFKAADWSDAANQAKSACDNEILYCGYRWDPESGNYQVRNRYLTPPLGRWLTTDPIGYGDGMNVYQYVGGRPVLHTDSSGQAVDPGKDCGLWSRSNHTGFIGPITKPTHFWLNTDSGELWDFGPNHTWLQARYGTPAFEDCSIFKYCRGEANYHTNRFANETGDVNKRPKLQLLNIIWLGKGRGKTCQCASCDEIKDCLTKVRENWDGTRYDHLGRHCGHFVLDAAAKCCLRGI